MDLESKHLHNCNLITKLNHTPTELPIATDCCFFFSIFFSFYGFLNLSSSIAIFLSVPCAASRFSKKQNLDIHNHKVSSIFISFFFLCAISSRCSSKLKKLDIYEIFKRKIINHSFGCFSLFGYYPSFPFIL